jgi:glycosidase
MTKNITRFSVFIVLFLLTLGVSLTSADHTPPPTSVTIPGDLQSELGCPGDWDPACANTHLVDDAADTVWQGSFMVPAGGWHYKAALNDSWDENYGQNATANGADIPLNLAAPTTVKFYYSHQTHWVTDNQNSRIATAPGSYQSEIGCPGDWQPDCLRSWLQDPDGDGLYSFTTDAIPAGNYHFKVAINEAWDENYGAGGVANGPDIPFSVPANASVTFSFHSATNMPSVTVDAAGHDHDNNVEYFGLGHNSHDTLYRVPFGSVVPDTEVIVRFRTYHHDVTSVTTRFYSTTGAAESFQEMELVAEDVSCYDPAQPDESCDFWQTTITPEEIGLLYYRFIIKDGTATAYYDDDVFVDGGWGEANPALQDDSYVITVYDPAFEPIGWMQDAVVYQIFPDRFRNGRANNDATPNEPRYGYPPEPLDQILVKEWIDLPEGHCRFYVNPAEPCSENPRGRDYFGGDLRGVQQRLNYLQAMGVTVIYFNPLFEAASNHAYDTQDYYSIDHFFGNNAEFEQFVQKANQHGIRVILDGVFNHVSSDSAYFDRYHHFSTVGACESLDSPYRDWFFFTDVAPGTGTCVGSDGTPDSANYNAWFGFDSLPVLDKNHPEVRDLVYAADNAVARYWLDLGASGWRLDVMGDLSFPADFWPEFRQAVKETQGDAVIVGELWKKHETLDKIQGNMADTSMNYRFRNAILGFFGTVDNKGFPDDGQSNQPPSLFALKLTSVREDYPDAAYYTMLNLMSSHDTMRILWALTPGENNREDREFNAANLAQGKELLRLASIVQFTIPGAPMVYYGDEVGVTGDDDPDDRRTFPWNGTGPYGVGGDVALMQHFQMLAGLRADNPVFRDGELSFLLTDDTNRTLGYLMRTASQAAVVALNRNSTPQTVTINVSGRLPDSVVLSDALGTVGSVTAVNGVLTLTLPPLSAAVLLPQPGQDLIAPAAPAALTATADGVDVAVNWNSVPTAAAYRLYRSPVSGGGYELLAEVSGTTYTDLNLRSGQPVYYVVSAVDAAGNEGPLAMEASAVPAYNIGWANLQWPPAIIQPIGFGSYTENVFGQVWIDGVTSQPGPTENLRAQVGFGPEGSNPAGNAAWSWSEAVFNTDVGNNDEFMAQMLPQQVGLFDYVYRYSTNGGLSWLYADLNGPVATGGLPPNPGKLTVNSTGDLTPPAAPTGLTVVSAAPNAIDLAWDSHPNSAGDLAGFELYREGLLLTTIAGAGATSYTDGTVAQGNTYEYTLVAVDNSYNRSGPSNAVTATAALRTVFVTFNVTVPEWTPASQSVHIAGSLHLLDGNLPEWDSSGVSLTQVGDDEWEITLSGLEGTNIEYKYTLGSPDFFDVEKGAACEELNNRSLALDYGTDGTLLVTDTVLNWRNVAPCGN